MPYFHAPPFSAGGFGDASGVGEMSRTKYPIRVVYVEVEPTEIRTLSVDTDYWDYPEDRHRRIDSGTNDYL